MSVNLSDILQNYNFRKCFDIGAGNYIFTAFTMTNLFVLLPLLIMTLSVVLQRWWQQYPAPTSHSDCVIFNMAVLELFFLFTTISFCIAYYTHVHIVMMVTSKISFIFVCRQIYFHILACLERYLAVVHPLVYMHSKKDIIRWIFILFSWLFSLGELFLITIDDFSIIMITYLIKQILCLIIISYCSIAVMYVLRQPCVQTEVKERTDQTKQRAFNSILFIMITLLIRFCGTLIFILVFLLSIVSITFQCILISSSFWFGLPSSLVLPLLFLHKEGKLPSCWTRAGE